MAELNTSQRTKKPIASHSFELKILGVDGDLPLVYAVDAVRGLGTAKTNIIRFRNGAISDTTTTPYSGISTPDPVTLEGVVSFDMADLKELETWADQVKGKATSAFVGGEYRDVTIEAVVRNKWAQTISGVTGAGKLKLTNCLLTGLSVSDFDINASEVSTYTLTLEYQEMEVL